MFGIPTEFIFGTATTVISWWLERDSRKFTHEEQSFELEKLKLEKEIAEMDNATKRAPSWLRTAIIAVVFIPVMFGLVYFSTRTDIPITLVDQDHPQKSLLFGLFKWGNTVKMYNIDGFPILRFITHAFAQILGFTFGRTLARRN